MIRWRASGATFPRAAFLGIAGVAILAVPLEADDPEPPASRGNAGADVVSQEIDVRLAEIEIVVTDRQGDPVAGLTREDFRVLQDGREVELTHFRAVAGGRPTVAPRAPAPGVPAPGAPASATDPATQPAALLGGDSGERLHLVVYIDRGYLEPGDLRDVRPALKDFLRHSLAPGDRVMLVTAGPSLELLQAFTSVPELVVSKIDGVSARPGGARMSREYQSILTDMRRIKNEGNDLMARDPSRQARVFVSRIQAFAAEVESEVERTTGQLRQLIQRVAGLPGRRAVLYVGGRVPAAHGRRLFEVWEDTFGRSSSLQFPDNPGVAEIGVGGGTGADAASSDTGLDSLAAASASFDLGARRAVEEAAKAASGHGVVVHTLDAGSLRDASFLGPGDATVPARGSSTNPGGVMAAGSLADAMSSLRSLAWRTGGRAFAGGRDFGGALSRVGSDLRTYYSLGFEPLAAPGGGSRIEVELADSRPTGGGRRGKLVVRHRTRLELKDRDTLAAERTISALLLEDGDNPLAVALSAGEPMAAGRDWRVPVSVTIPLAKLALVADGRVHAGRLSIYSVSGNLDRIGAMTKAVVPVRIPNQDLLTSLGRRVEYQLQLILPGSAGGQVGRKIAVTVRDDFRPRSSTAVGIVPISVDVAKRPELDSR